MPVIRTIQAERGIEVGGAPSTRIDSSVGQGLQQLGGAISDAGQVQNQLEMRRIQQSQQIDEFKTNQELQRFGDDMSLEFAKTQQNIDPSGKGFTDNVSGVFNKRADEFLQNVPDGLKPKFAELVKTSRNQWIDKAAAAEIDQRQTWYRTGITERQQTLQNQVFNDPSMFDAAKSDAYRTIETSGLPPVEKEALKKKTDEMFALTVGEREIRDAEVNPSKAADAAVRLGVQGVRGAPVDQFVDKIIGVESGGRANAKNPNSSASGLGQFLDSTWLATVRKYRPDIAAGQSSQAILSLKTDPKLGREMTRAYAQENAQFLRNAGVQETAGNIYLAHFLGPRGAVQVLKADPNAPIAGIVGQDVVKANSFLAGKSAADVAQWATKKMGGASASTKVSTEPADPRFASLPLEKRLSIFDQVEASAKRGQTIIDAQTKAAYDTQKGAIELGIQTGEVSSPEQILSSPMRDDDKASLLSSLRTRQGDDFVTAQALSDFQNGSLTVDPYSTNGKKTVDAIETKIMSAVPPEQQQIVTESLVKQSGIVPQKTMNSLRAGLESTSVADVEKAAQQAARISQINPAALSRREGGTQVQKMADDFNYYVNKLNLSPTQAAQKIADLNNPEKQRDRKALEPAAKEFKKAVESEDLGAMFDESILPFNDPAIGFTEGQALGIHAEYLAIAEEQFYQSNGNVEVAKNRAQEEMKRLYGVSAVAGKPTVMKHPPEKYWPQIAPTSATGAVFGDPLQYAKTQLYADLYEIDPKIDSSSVQFVSTPETDAMVKRGEMPAYSVFYTDSNGVLQTMAGKLWRPDITQQMKMQADRQALENAGSLDQARFRQDINKTDAEMQADPLGAREASQDAFLAGPDATPQGAFKANKAALPPQKPDTPQNRITEQRQSIVNDAQNSGMLDPMGNGF